MSFYEKYFWLTIGIGIAKTARWMYVASQTPRKKD